jgi:hypothetical protein
MFRARLAYGFASATWRFLAIFMERPASLIFAIGCWTASGVLFALVRFIDRIN